MTPLMDRATVDAPLSYVCRRCDVYGFLPAGGVMACWCCGDRDRMARR